MFSEKWRRSSGNTFTSGIYKNSTMNLYMGVDIGTSGCKAVVFDENGRQFSYAHREYDIISKNDGWAELDTDEVIEKCFCIVKESAGQIAPYSVTGMGISSQGEAFTMLDKEGKALYYALSSSDVRAQEYAKNWAGEFGEEKLYRITGHTAHPMFSLFKLQWIKDNMPEIWMKAHKILCFEDLLQYRLGIKDPAIGWPLAGRTMLFDVTNHSWSKEILDDIGVRKTQLARPLPSGTVAGYVNKEIAKALNLSEHTFIVTGGHDQPCSALGAGALEPGIAAYTSGTVDCITPAFDKPVFTEMLKQSNLCTYDHAATGMYATVAFSLTGGNILKWFRDEFGSAEIELANKSNIDPYELLLNQMPDKPTKLQVLPYFTPTGTPYFDTSARGAIIGLDLSTTRGEIIKALLEGVAFEIRLNLEILEKSGYGVNELRVIGGGAKSKVWNQLKADVTGKPITVLNVTEAGCMGVAMLARATHIKRPVSEVAGKWIKTISKVVPVSHQYYDQKFTSYKELYPSLKNRFF